MEVSLKKKDFVLIKAYGALLFGVFTCLFGLVLDSGLVSAQTSQAWQQKTARYVCPMHPEVTAAVPGRCPTCGMTLKVAVDAPPASPKLLPDIRVRDHNGTPLTFYSDLVKGRTVAINFIFTTCTTVCPSLTATLRRVQQELLKRSLDVQLISISVDPTTDTPERLHDFAAKFQAGPGWTFVTGDKTEIESLLQALGAAVADTNDHTSMILVNNDVTGFRTRTYGLSSPAGIVQVLAEAASRK
jgi:cytochrome oxidase Cu insertion factor (SCO1/SenC/PrrC family)